MRRLIEITSIPIEIRMKRTNATLEYTRGTVEMEVSRSDDGIDIKSRPARLQLDTFEQRSGGVMPQQKGTAQPLQAGQADFQSAYQATVASSEQGQIRLSARIGQEMNQGGASVADLQQNVVDSVTSALAAATAEQAVSAPPANAMNTGASEYDWDEGEQMEILYDMDKLHFDWKIDRGKFKFTPGDIELTVEQRPKVLIKYLGGPIYVPPSADPNYEPVDVKA